VTRLRAENKPTIPVLLGEEKKANVFLRADEPSVAAKLHMKGASAGRSVRRTAANARTSPDGAFARGGRDYRAAAKLKPHPEGGHYRETFRDQRTDANERSCATAIYFLLARGERSHWHRIDAVEVWHYYAGAPLILQIAHEGCTRHTVQARPPRGWRRTAAGDRARRRVAGRREHRRLDLGRLHGCSRIPNLRSSNWRRRVGSRRDFVG
jgi:hypothetical protein